VIGPLHGLPLSVKEHIPLKGLDVNAALVAWVGTIAAADAHIVEILGNAGAVFFARTTQPQLLMHLETSSNLYGETVNPYNRHLTSGGSSGGEGSLMGLRGSCLGIGSDIGGSVRSPAANCGVYGLKPTTRRLPLSGCVATMLAQEHIFPTLGPLSTSIEGLRLFMRTVVAAKPWIKEPGVLPFEWRDDKKYLPDDDAAGPTLRIGVLWDDDVVKPHPPILRALRELTKKLKTIPGVEVFDWKPYKHDYAWKIISSLYFADGGAENYTVLKASGEPLRPLSSWILEHAKRLTVEEIWHWTMQREIYRSEYAAHWNATGADVLLCPVGPGAAPPLNGARYWGYTSQWNLLDYPAVVFPVRVFAWFHRISLFNVLMLLLGQ
jgi:amidase